MPPLSGQAGKKGADSVNFDLAGGSKHWDDDTFRDSPVKVKER